jgi:hypothetical protein
MAMIAAAMAFSKDKTAQSNQQNINTAPSRWVMAGRNA